MPAAPRKKSRWRWVRRFFGLLLIALVVGRLMLPSSVRWYVNRTIDRNPIFHGKIGDVHIHLWRGAYSIDEIRLIKTTGNVPVPLFSAKHLDLSIQWNALLHGRLVGQIDMEQPELNFVDAPDESSSQSGAGGPWLAILRDLFPFQINRAEIHGGAVHFRAFQTDPPFDVYLDHLEATISNLSNINNDTTPLMATVSAKALAMGHAHMDYQMKFDPTSYRPSFDIAVKLIGLDVTKTNNLSRAYGKFDFEKGWFDLVVELHSTSGTLDGYIKPLFRNLQIFGTQDLKEDNVLGAFWEALLGLTTRVLSNPPRDQFGTYIPVHGDLDSPRPDILSTIGNVLRNAFIRAYLPRLQGSSAPIDGLQFGEGTGSITDPGAPGNDR